MCSWCLIFDVLSSLKFAMQYMLENYLCKKSAKNISQESITFEVSSLSATSIMFMVQNLSLWLHVNFVNNCRVVYFPWTSLNLMLMWALTETFFRVSYREFGFGTFAHGFNIDRSYMQLLMGNVGVGTGIRDILHLRSAIQYLSIYIYLNKF